MAKKAAKKAAKKKANRMGRPPLPEEVKKDVRFGMRISKAMRRWLIGFANFRRRDKADLVYEALEEHAEKHGYEAPPKR